ncbi:MAG: type II secretion system ATPase GspE [Methylococcaceae bacterium]|nr:type II secretion system ATPase GspE [Methylococcaceae bacterium]MCI0667391.1 type II secretion system ATPase GspE [Methylococcaceae bacterium]
MNTIATLKSVADTAEAESEITEAGLPARPAKSGYDAFADVLLKRGDLRENDLKRATRLAEQAGDEKLPALLVKLGLLSEKDAASALSEVSGLPLVTEKDYSDSSPFGEEISLKFLREYHVAGVAREAEGIVIAMADPYDDYVVQALSLASNENIRKTVGIASEIDQVLERQFGSGKSLMGQIGAHLGVDGDIDEYDIQQLKDLASEAPVIRMVNLILQNAVESRASDVHIEPFEQQLKVRLRVDGVLREIEAPPQRSTAAVISRIKIMANLNIAERRLPQDGRINLQVLGKELDLRVSTVPTMHGESVVIRLLDKKSIVLDFESLGFQGEVLQRFLEILQLPHGIILITGPTGSGKTTNLYTALHRLNTPERKIITVEDPVEYQLAGINQIQTKSQIGLTFANALRSIVRQDPDVIMIGEMRDLETARIAVQSALTGHLVLSTLHTNDAAGGITRLLDMGLDDYLLTSTVNGILAQRLVRRLCVHCRKPYEALPEVVQEMKLRRFVPEGPVILHEPVGCAECSGIGYLGRMAILEFLVMSDPLRRLVLAHSESSQIQAKAVEEGMETMYEDGLRKALSGLTTIEEVLRVSTDS